MYGGPSPAGASSTPPMYLRLTATNEPATPPHQDILLLYLFVFRDVTPCVCSSTGMHRRWNTSKELILKSQGTPLNTPQKKKTHTHTHTQLSRSFEERQRKAATYLPLMCSPITVTETKTQISRTPSRSVSAFLFCSHLLPVVYACSRKLNLTSNIEIRVKDEE